MVAGGRVDWGAEEIGDGGRGREEEGGEERKKSGKKRNDRGREQGKKKEKRRQAGMELDAYRWLCSHEVVEQGSSLELEQRKL